MKKWLILLLSALVALPAALGLAQDTLRVTFYDMGKADAMLITTAQNAHILIDAGTNKGGKQLSERLLTDGIDTLDLMIITHYDKDHVGGADVLLKNLTVKQVIMPQYPKESKQYDQFVEALAQSPDTVISRMGTNEQIEQSFGGVLLLTSSAQQSDYGQDEENDFSLVTRLRFGKTRFLFTGDAEDARQTELLLDGDLACDVLKVPYHGRLVNASAAFIAACHPQIAFITDSTKEPANALLIEQLKAVGADVYCAKDGEISVCSDGETVWLYAQ